MTAPPLDPPPVVSDPEPAVLQFVGYAGFASRLVAMVVDLLIVSITWIFWGFALTFLSQTSGINGLLAFVNSFFNWIIPYQNLLSILLEISTLLLIAQLYFTFFYGFGGATIGKYLMGLQVVRRNGQPLSLARAALRTLAYLVSTPLIYAGFINILIDDRRRGWHDLLAGTVVVHSWRDYPDGPESFELGEDV
ncbi:RDD family protein [Candidatus Chloroploca sp. Khr17]|uniref:RDD family protein n=1 Tax=Candidatus Chloroploca sp. Khr17 TaxID=2496869 RepID=UPI00101BF9AE|nr:RDD family protein [Candidatus Chloroploca sp. Khr17]